MPTESMDNLSSLCGLPGLCPEYLRTLSRLPTGSMDNVQGVHGFSVHFTDGNYGAVEADSNVSE